MRKSCVGGIAMSLLVLVVPLVSCSQEPEQRTEAVIAPGVSLPEPTEGTFGAACAQLRGFLAMERGAVSPGVYRTAAIEAVARLDEAFREPRPMRTEAGLCRAGSEVFRFDDGSSMVRHINGVLERADLDSEVLGRSEGQLLQELLDDFRVRIANERVGAKYHGLACSAQSQWTALMSTVQEAVTRWRFTIAELDLTPEEREDLAARMGTPLPESPIPVEGCQRGRSALATPNPDR